MSTLTSAVYRQVHQRRNLCAKFEEKFDYVCQPWDGHVWFCNERTIKERLSLSHSFITVIIIIVAYIAENIIRIL